VIPLGETGYLRAAMTANYGLWAGIIYGIMLGTMALRITLNDGREVLVRATLDQGQNALHSATATGELLEIEQPGGQVLAISPQEVRYAVEDPQAGESLARRFEEPAAAAR